MRIFDSLVYADPRSEAFAYALAEATAADLVAVLDGRADLGLGRRELLAEALAIDPRFEGCPVAGAWLAREVAAERAAADSLARDVSNGLDLGAEHAAAIAAGDRPERYYVGLARERVTPAGLDDWGGEATSDKCRVSSDE